MKIKVAIIEDLKDVAQMLCDNINDEEDMECHQVYNNAEDAMTFLSKNPAHIAIVDIGLPRASGLDAIRFLTPLCPDMQFCMFTVYEDDEKIFESLKAGAKGYIMKGESSAKIINYIKELHNGGSPMSHNIARRILTLLSKGLLYKEIGDQMGITTGTVKQHIHKIYEKLHVSNRTEALNVFHNR